MPLPPRRWFQFRLSTWFVLMAILAWAMTEWPWTTTKTVHYASAQVIVNARGIRLDSGRLARQAFVIRKGNRTYLTGTPFVRVQSYNADLLYPALALAAFVGWKVVWAIGRRVRARNARVLDFE